MAGCVPPVQKPQPPAEIKEVTAAKRMNEKLKLTKEINKKIGYFKHKKRYTMLSSRGDFF